MKIVSVLLIVLIACPVYAQDLSIELQELMDVRVVSIDNAEWLAFTVEDAKAILKMRLDFPEMKKALDLFSDSLEIKEKIILKQGHIIQNQKDQIGILGNDNKSLRAELAAERKWYKDPWFWFAAGIVVGGGAVAAVAVGVK